MSGGPFSDRTLHFVGIGGAGMSGLAVVAAQLGARVSGSDQAESSYTQRLREHGIQAAVGHDAANLAPGAEVVVSTAIPESNPELAAARGAGATILHRGELLGEVSRLKRSIAVSGTHGKTTTCAMIVQVLAECGQDPAYLVGGELRSSHTNAGWGAGDWIVVEADESDRSFLHLAPEVAVVTNVELDHHATYRSLSELGEAFAGFAAPAATRITGPGVQLADSLSYGIGESPRSGALLPNLCAEALELRPLGSRFVVEAVNVELNVPGRHNVLNALAALAACRAAGVDLIDAAPALAGFAGTGRRFEDRGTTSAGARVFDDYAHHPTEVRATLEAVRTLNARRVVACFQPHLYSRTRELARDFGRALALADLTVVVDIYPARERAEDFPGVSGLLVAQATADAAGGRPVWWLPSMDAAAQRLRADLGEGDVVLTLGAGDVNRLAGALTTEAN
jgi:UDP-N-acetylmuramate--alanine ligase